MTKSFKLFLKVSFPILVIGIVYYFVTIYQANNSTVKVEYDVEKQDSEIKDNNSPSLPTSSDVSIENNKKNTSTAEPLENSDAISTNIENTLASFDELIINEKKVQEKAFGYFKKIKNINRAFETDEYDVEWSNKMLDNINDHVLFNNENGEVRFSAIQVNDLECKGTLCKLDFSNISNNDDAWDEQRMDLMYALLNLNSKNPQEPSSFDRSIKAMSIEGGGIRYYISRGVSDLQ
ncbi:MAG: hypothetical protein HRT53_19295 [Colwellia sp.]|nr:hypothetical protein [Colwellia sp.]